MATRPPNKTRCTEASKHPALEAIMFSLAGTSNFKEQEFVLNIIECTKMVSPRKSASAMSNVSVIEQRNNAQPRSTKSCESLYSNSSKGSASGSIRQRVPPAMHANAPSIRQPAIIPATTEVRQRVLSARRLRIKTFQNQLANAQQTIAELAHENRMLRTLHKRQDSALAKYEANNAELPQLLHSHAEELRVWQTKCRNQQTALKELEQKLKQKEAIILSLSDQNKYYIQLNKDKNLDDRQRLTEKLHALESRLQEKDNDIKLMARKMQLENKQAKQHLLMEQKKTKEVLMKLEKARLELSGFRKLEEMQLQEKFNLGLRRNKSTLSDDHKPDRDADRTLTISTIQEESETMSPTQRSTHSTQRSNRTVKKIMVNSNDSADFNSTNAKLGRNEILKLPQRRCTDQGDGDASKISSKKQQSTPIPTLPSLAGLRPQRLLGLQYDDDFEDEEEDISQGNDNNETDNEEGNTHSIGRTEPSEDNDEDDLGSGGRFISNIDLPSDKKIFEESLEFYRETRKEIQTTVKNQNASDDMSSIRKQISNDYKEREAFLDTFCRQATGEKAADTPTKRNSIATEQAVPANRKHKLLAALKAIDDNKSQD